MRKLNFSSSSTMSLQSCWFVLSDDFHFQSGSYLPRMSTPCIFFCIWWLILAGWKFPPFFWSRALLFGGKEILPDKKVWGVHCWWWEFLLQETWTFKGWINQPKCSISLLLSDRIAQLTWLSVGIFWKFSPSCMCVCAYVPWGVNLMNIEMPWFW